MDIIKKVTKDAERLLRSLRASYYIKLPTGEEISHGMGDQVLQPAPKVKEKKQRITRTGEPYGALSAYYKPYLETCKNVGDVTSIPIGKYNAEHLRGSIAAHLSVVWGKGTYASVLNRETGHVQVMRTAENIVKAPPTGLSKSQEKRIAAQSKVNGTPRQKFHTVGHGMESLQNLKFDDEDRR